MLFYNHRPDLCLISEANERTATPARLQWRHPEGDLVWLTDHRPMELAIVLGESHRENVLVRPVKGGYDFTVSDIDCEKVKKDEKKL